MLFMSLYYILYTYIKFTLMFYIYITCVNLILDGSNKYIRIKLDALELTFEIALRKKFNSNMSFSKHMLG